MPVEIAVVDQLDGGSDKLALVERLGPEHTIAVGNGYNDAKMLGAAALSVVVLGSEGAAGAALAKADVVVSTPEDALSLILNPKRLVATLHR